MKDSFGEIYSSHFSSCADFGEEYLLPIAGFLLWGCAIFAAFYYGVSTWNSLDWWGVFRLIAAVVVGLLSGVFFFILTGLALLATGFTGFILMLIGCLISSSFVYFNQPDPLTAAIRGQIRATVAAQLSTIKTQVKAQSVSGSVSSTVKAAVPATASKSPARPSGPRLVDINRVQKIIDDTQKTLNAIDRNIQTAVMQLKITWPKAANAFIASINVSDLAKKNIQVTRDLKDRAIAVAQLDAHKLQLAADGWAHTKALLRGVRTELDLIEAEPSEYSNLSNHIEAFHKAIKGNLEKREWTHNQTVLSGIHGLIKEMSPFLKEARILGFQGLDEISRQNLTVNYRNLAMMTHPDRNPSPDAHEMFARIERAHQRLKIYLTQKGNAA